MMDGAASDASRIGLVRVALVVLSLAAAAAACSSGPASSTLPSGAATASASVPPPGTSFTAGPVASASASAPATSPTAASSSTTASPPATTPPTSPVDGVILTIDSQGLTKVRGFTLRTNDGRVLTFTIGQLDNPTQFPPGHLAEHQASASPVRIFFRAANGSLVVYRIEDAPG